MLKPVGFLVRTDIYPVWIYVSVNQSDAAFRRWLKKEGVPAPGIDYLIHKGFGTAGEAHSLTGGVFVIRLAVGPSTDTARVHGIIAHEALHTTMSIMRYIGCRMSERSEEAYTYLLQFIVEEAIRGLEYEVPSNQGKSVIKT